MKRLVLALMALLLLAGCAELSNSGNRRKDQNDASDPDAPVRDRM